MDHHALPSSSSSSSSLMGDLKKLIYTFQVEEEKKLFFRIKKKEAKFLYFFAAECSPGAGHLEFGGFLEFA